MDETLSDLRAWVGRHLEPTKPQAVAPTNGATGVTRAILEWSCTGADRFDVYGSDDQTLVSNLREEARLANDTNQLTYIFPEGTRPPAATVYYWRVVACNKATGKKGVKSAVFSFTTALDATMPVDCKLSDPVYAGDWVPTSAWSACSGGTQTRMEQRAWTKSIVTAPANGGAACGPTSGVEIRSVSQPCDVPAPGVKRVITKADLSFKGFYRIDPYILGWWSRAGLTSRVVNGARRFFVLGDETEGNELVEVGVPDQPPALDYSTAPALMKVQSWGKPFTHRWTGGGNTGWIGGLHWDEARQALYYAYGEGYVPIGHDCSLGAVQLKPDGSTQTFGNWRTEWHSQRTRGSFTTIPAAFADAYCQGRTTGITSFQTSGNYHSPFGASLAALTLPELGAASDDPKNFSDWSVACHGVILHDIEHRQARDTRYKTCGWNVKYDCRQGSYIKPGVPLFGGPDPAAGESDSSNSAVWVDLPDKHGLIFFGTLVTTPSGYTAPGDPDGFTHMWYGDPYHTGSTMVLKCCHGQDDPWWQGTGPGAHYRVPILWIYDPVDLVKPAQGTADLWSVKPSTDLTELRSFSPQLPVRDTQGALGGAVIDPQARRLYLLLVRHDRTTHSPHPRPIVAVFEIA